MNHRITFSRIVIAIFITLFLSNCNAQPANKDSLIEPRLQNGALGDNIQQTPNVPTIASPMASLAGQTLNSLGQAVVPISDLYDLACRLKNVCNVPRSLLSPVPQLKVGAQEKFWVYDAETGQEYQTNATLMYITPHSYFWVQNNVQVNQANMRRLMDTFENKIYPTDHQFFGSEWMPGVDNDPHIYILYVRGLSVAGYFDARDEYTSQIYKYSNEHEMFVFNAAAGSLSTPFTYSILAHEFQHMIRWSTSRGETAWLNEGSSVLAQFVNGYPAYFDKVYTQNPDVNLTDWIPDTAHYGEAFLFTDYFLDRFGPSALQTLAADQAHGLAGVDDTLRKLNITDSQTGKVITADDLALDWFAAMYLKDGAIGDGRYTYHNYPDAPQAHDTKTITTCPQAPTDGVVNQYGAEYINISCTGNYTLSFKGSTETKLLPVKPHSGNYMFWSNEGDVIDTSLTHEFDFTHATSPISMSYWVWYNIEKGYDYAYIEASTDGQHWDILRAPSCFDNDTSGNAYGCAYTGTSGGGGTPEWINETVDLSQYANKKVQLRFEYVTDQAVNLDGLLLDDISIPAINYSTDFETEDGGWQAKGFVRVASNVPQTYRLALIKKGARTTIQNISLAPDQTINIPLSLQAGQDAVLVVIGTERYTREVSSFTLSVDQGQ